MRAAESILAIMSMACAARAKTRGQSRDQLDPPPRVSSSSASPAPGHRLKASTAGNGIRCGALAGQGAIGSALCRCRLRLPGRSASAGLRDNIAYSRLSDGGDCRHGATGSAGRRRRADHFLHVNLPSPHRWSPGWSTTYGVPVFDLHALCRLRGAATGRRRASVARAPAGDGSSPSRVEAGSPSDLAWRTRRRVAALQ